MDIFTYKEAPASLMSPFAYSAFESSIVPETDSHGAIEYKLHMINPHHARLAQLTTQLQWRLTQGQGQAIYEIGVADDGTLIGLLDLEIYASLRTLKMMATSVGAWFKVVRVIPVQGQELARQDANRRIVEVHVYKTAVDKAVVKMFIIGGPGTGKSTLLGTLCYDGLDNGRGKARVKVLKHRHELVSGRTSSIGIDVFGYNQQRPCIGSFESDESLFDYEDEDSTPAPDNRVLLSNYTSKFTYEEIVASSARVIMAFDTPGAINKIGLVCRHMALYAPDVTVVAVCENSRWSEYLDLALRATSRVAVLLTKSDMFTGPDHLKTLLRSILVQVGSFKRSGNANVNNVSDGQPLFGKMVNSNAVAIDCAASQACVPVFLLSAVSGSGTSFLHEFLNALEVTKSFVAQHKEEKIDDCQLDVSEVPRGHLIHHTSNCNCSAPSRVSDDPTPANFYVTSVYDSGRILTGVVRSGKVMLGRAYYVGGPDKSTRIVVQSMQKLRVPCLELHQGDIGSIGIEVIGGPIKLQRGMGVFSSHEVAFSTELVIKSDCADMCQIGGLVTVYSGFERVAEIVKFDGNDVHVRLLGRGEYVRKDQRAIVSVNNARFVARLCV
ncbi:hypothetical protein V1512DRAFT_265675 [Lipomyces arxii]|uniref:uncharacterized protein n=1 Tax=Lipomyces arxii TaxID=56418 RepID=UPI0034CF9A0E